MIECQKSPLKGHCEPVTDVYFVAISKTNRFFPYFLRKMFENPGDCHSQCAHWLRNDLFFDSLSSRKETSGMIFYTVMSCSWKVRTFFRSSRDTST